MKKMYLLIVFIFSVVLTFTGCGTVNLNSNFPNTATITSSAPATSETSQPTIAKSNEITWIEFAWYTAYQYSVKPSYWILTKVKVGKIGVGQILAEIDDPNTQSGWHSNHLSVGTKLFCIPGINYSKAFVVQMKDGLYLKAIAAGFKKPS